MADNRNNLPDISGVFNIDESRIPSKIIEKPEEKKTAAQQSILLRPETRADEKKQEKIKKEIVKTKRKEAKRKVLKQRPILGGIALVVILALVLVVRSAILDRKKPVVSLAQITRTNVTSHYDTEGSVLGEETEDGAKSLFVVFVENDYDVYGLQKGQRAEIVVNEDVTVSGVVADIRKEESDSSVISRLIAVFSGAGFSTASNYAVYVAPDDATYLEENTPVKVTVTTGIAENVLAAPAGAIYKEDAQPYVWVYKKSGKKLKRQDVTVGLEADGVIEIRKGLSEGDFIVSGIIGDTTELYNNVKVKLSTDE